MELVCDYVNDFCSNSIQKQQEAADFFAKFTEQLENYPIAIQILQDQNNKIADFVALSLIQNLINGSWYELQLQQRSTIRKVFFQFVQFQEQKDVAVISQISELLGKIGILEWDTDWESFFFDCINYFPILASFAHEMNESRLIPSSKKNKYKGELINLCNEIYQSTFSQECIDIYQADFITELLQWYPISKIIDEKAIIIIIQTMKQCSDDKLMFQCIKLNDTLFIERIDSMEFFHSIDLNYLDELNQLAVSDLNVASLLSSVLTHYSLLLFNKCIDSNYKMALQYSFEIFANPGWSNDGYDDYWEFWGDIFIKYENGKPTNLNDPIQPLIIDIFDNMYQILPDSLNPYQIITQDHEQCLRVIYKLYSDEVIEYLQNQPIAPSFCFMVMALQRVTNDDIPFFLLQTISESNDSSLMAEIILTISCFYNMFSDNPEIALFFVNNIIELLLSNSEKQVKAAAYSYDYLAQKCPELVLYSYPVMFENLFNYISNISHGLYPIFPIRVLFQAFSSFTAKITDISSRNNYYHLVYDNILVFLKNNISNFGNSTDSRFDTIASAFQIILLSISSNYTLAIELHDPERKSISVISDVILPYLSIAGNTDQDQLIIENCFSIAGIVINSHISYDNNAENIYVEIVQKSLEKLEIVLEPFLKFLINVRSRFVETEITRYVEFLTLYERVFLPLLENIQDCSKYAFEYLLLVQFWKFGDDLPISSLCNGIINLSHDGIDFALKIIKKFISIDNQQKLANFFNIYSNDILEIIFSLSTDSYYSDHLKLVSRIFYYYLQAAKMVGMTSDELTEILQGICTEKLPHVDHDQILDFIKAIQSHYTEKDTIFFIMKTFAIMCHCCVSKSNGLFDFYQVRSLSELINEDYSNQTNDFIDDFDPFNYGEEDSAATSQWVSVEPELNVYMNSQFVSNEME